MILSCVCYVVLCWYCCVFFVRAVSFLRFFFFFFIGAASSVIYPLSLPDARAILCVCLSVCLSGVSVSLSVSSEERSLDSSDLMSARLPFCA